MLHATRRIHAGWNHMCVNWQTHTHTSILLCTKEWGSGDERKRGQGSLFHFNFSILPLCPFLSYPISWLGFLLLFNSTPLSLHLSINPFELGFYSLLNELREQKETSTRRNTRAKMSYQLIFHQVWGPLSLFASRLTHVVLFPVWHAEDISVINISC